LVNADDYGYIDRAYAMQVIAATDTPSISLGISAVPEPTTVALLTFLSTIFVRRRRSA